MGDGKGVRKWRWCYYFWVGFFVYFVYFRGSDFFFKVFYLGVIYSKFVDGMMGIWIYEKIVF